MRGYPIFNLNEKVRFRLGEGLEERIGFINIIDKYGTWDDPSDVSYDIMSEYEGKECLFKHITEKLVKPYEDRNTDIL